VSGSLQLGFSDYEQVYAKKKTRRQIFLDEMQATLTEENSLGSGTDYGVGELE
jgi:hypothetical protein